MLGFCSPDMEALGLQSVAFYTTSYSVQDKINAGG